MVQKPIVRNWHREAYATGNKEGIPPEALAILEAEKKEQKAEKKAEKKEEK